jgi:gentisate 1,2-dioxygenase
MSKMVPSHPNPTAVAASWKYTKVRPSLIEAGDIIDAEEAERRVLMLVNPAMGDFKLPIKNVTSQN